MRVSLVFAGLSLGCTGQTPMADPICEDLTIEAPLQVEPCELRLEALSSETISPELADLAPQYFHAWTGATLFRGWRDGDAIAFDPWALDAPVLAPADAWIQATTSRWVFLSRPDDEHGELGIMARATGAVTWTGLAMQVRVAVEREAGFFVFGQLDGAPAIAALTDDLTVEAVHRPPSPVIAMGENSRNTQFAVSQSGVPAVAWTVFDGGSSRLVFWQLGLPAAVVVDQLTQEARLTDLSRLSGGWPTLAPHGETGFALAWRPLVDCGFDNYGTTRQPPSWNGEAPPRGELRWLVFDGRPEPVKRWEMPVGIIGIYSGSGPWGFDWAGISAASVDGRAAFLWLDYDGHIRAVAADGARPVDLGPHGTRSYRPLLLQTTPGDLLVLGSELGSTPGADVPSFTLSCE